MQHLLALLGIHIVNVLFQDPLQMFSPLEIETQVVGTDETHRQIPQQLPLRGVSPEESLQEQPDLTEPLLEPLTEASDPKPQHYLPPLTVPLSSSSSVNDTTQLAASTEQMHVMHSANSEHYGGEQPSSDTFSASGDPYQISPHQDNSGCNLDNYATQEWKSQQATFPQHGATYQPKDTTGKPQHPPQAYQTHHDSHSQPPQEQSQPSPLLLTSETVPEEPRPMQEDINTPVLPSIGTSEAVPQETRPMQEDLKTPALPSIGTIPPHQSNTNTTTSHADDDLELEMIIQASC